MRLKITLSPEKPLVLPLHYNEIIQGFIYHQLEPKLATWLHGDAYKHAQKYFRMFTFSKLYSSERFEIIPTESKKLIKFHGDVWFKLSAYNPEVLVSFAEHLLSEKESFCLGTQTCRVKGVEILAKPRFNKGSLRVEAISPITAHETYFESNKKKTHYYTPFEAAWAGAILCNLADKARALGWEDAGRALYEESSIMPENVSSKNQTVVKYKNFVIKGWKGSYRLNMPEAYCQLAYDTGLGARNAQGFGMIEAI